MSGGIRRPGPVGLTVACVLTLAVVGAYLVTHLKGDGAGAADPTARSGEHQVGVVFTPTVRSSVTGILYYDDGAPGGVGPAALWGGDRRLIASATTDGDRSKGWHLARLTRPVDVEAGTRYTVSVLSSATPVTDRAVVGRPPEESRDRLDVDGALLGRGDAYPTQSIQQATGYPVLPALTDPMTPAPPGAAIGPTPTPSDGTRYTQGFPNAMNTGVPPGTALSTYTGSCTITDANTVIDSKRIDCHGALVIKAAGTVIRRSKIFGTVDSDSGAPQASLTIEDSEIDGNSAEVASVGSHDVTVLRSNIHGGMHSVQCNRACTVKDSFLHGQYIPPDGDWHVNAFISNGGSNMTLVHNTLQCDARLARGGGGCSADLSIFGDFEGNSNYTIDNNLFVASKELAYCAYGGNDPGKKYGNDISDIRFTRNVFERGANGKCGLYGAITSFNASKPGMVWTGNIWDDGKPVLAE